MAISFDPNYMVKIELGGSYFVNGILSSSILYAILFKEFPKRSRTKSIINSSHIPIPYIMFIFVGVSNLF